MRWWRLVVLALSAPAAAHPQTLRLATWNMEWLMMPATYDMLSTSCVAGQPPSNLHALPCPEPGRAPVPRHSDADLSALARQALRLHADVVALQEVDGPAVAARVFPGYRVDCFVARAHPQKTGFAIREGIPYRCNAELGGMDDDDRARAGADVTLWPDTTYAVRLLSVHLKSGCFAERLDDTANPVCARLRTQLPVLEAWVDARVRDGEAFAIMGDFNRRLEIDARLAAEPDEAAPLALFSALDDNVPKGARLIRATGGSAYVGCSANDHYDSYIDNVLISRSLAARASKRRFVRLAYDEPDASTNVLSDHCPLGLELVGVGPKRRN
jgi:endonuclease/exonuclease/phosphatase family metal-dependent hydrolase